MRRSDFHTHRQRCNDICTNLSSLHGNVAVLMYGVDNLLIFAARNNKLKAKSMEKQIICMGNSYKNGGRCLAGIEIQNTASGVSIVKNNYGLPKWIRPVMANGDNGLPECMVGSFTMLDILSVDVTDTVPTGSHCENVHFASIKKVGRLGQNSQNLNPLCDTWHTMIFGNRGKAVPNEVFENGDYSLMFIKPESPVITMQYDDYGHEKYRIQFIYKGNQYDFPLTDTRYINELRSRTKTCGGRNTGDLYLTLSLGVNHYDWHYKLVAGVIDLAS